MKSKCGNIKFLLKFLSVVLVGLLMVSCEEKTDWDIPEGADTIVIEAIITNEYKNQRIRLTKPYLNPNGEAVPVSDATVYIQAGNSVEPFYESEGLPGNYFTAQPAAASINQIYRLVVEVDDQVFAAEAVMEPVLPANNPGFVLNPATGLYRLQWNNPQYNPFEQAMYEAVVSWSHLVDPSITDTLAFARMMHYTLKTIDVSYNIFPQDTEEIFFPKNSYVIIKKYSVSEEYGAYLRALLAETEWQGSLFEDARGNLPTNISNGGLGFFSVSAVISDTLVVQ